LLLLRNASRKANKAASKWDCVAMSDSPYLCSLCRGKQGLAVSPHRTMVVRDIISEHMCRFQGNMN
jgi:hypothetical protein